MSWFNFGGQQQQQQPQQQQAPQSAPNAPSTSGGQASTNPPAGQQQNPPGNQQQQQPQNPLDSFMSLWDNTKQQQQEAPPSFNLNPEEVKKISSSMRFTDGISQEQFQQAMNGDQQAFFAMMDHVGRQAYSTALQHGGALTDRFVGARSEYENKKVPSQVKKELVSANLQSAVNVQHPVIRKELTRIAEAMHSQNPDASPAEIAQAAVDYFSQISQAMTGQQQQEQQSKGDQPVDWDKFFD